MTKFEYPDLLNEMIACRFINVQKHPRYPLWIHNYNMRAQRHNAWNEATCACRGLIMDEECNIVSRPFKKFFNYEHVSPDLLPNEPFTVTDKIDGSLGISYWYDGVWRIATRGSFDGKQATKATQILHGKYAGCCRKMQPQYTYLFEIIYPANRIIVDYGDREELVLLAVIDTETGCELTDFAGIGFPVLKPVEVNSLDEVLKLNDDKAEGMVVRFESGFRIKVKFAEYLRLHRIMLGLSEIKVWRCLSSGYGVDKLYEMAGEEYALWIKSTAEKISLAYSAMCKTVRKEFDALPRFASQEEAAAYIEKRRNADILLNMLCGKPVEKMIWQLVKPDENASWFSERG
jgi:RNA ligase